MTLYMQILFKKCLHICMRKIACMNFQHVFDPTNGLMSIFFEPQLQLYNYIWQLFHSCCCLFAGCASFNSPHLYVSFFLLHLLGHKLTVIALPLQAYIYNLCVCTTRWKKNFSSFVLAVSRETNIYTRVQVVQVYAAAHTKKNCFKPCNL